jgi:hypothetical protein
MEKIMKLNSPTARIFLGLICALTSNLFLQHSVSAKNIYVSPCGSGLDGSSWATAWQDPAKIDWTKVTRGDQIILDGGTSGITYNAKATLNIPASNIIIKQSSEPNHTGQVTLNGWGNPRPLITGIKFLGSSIHLMGTRRSGIKVVGFGAESINVQTNYNSIQNVEFAGLTGYMPYGQGKIAGLTFGGNYNQFINCDFRGSYIGAAEKAVPGRNFSSFRNCTFGSNYYGYWMDNGKGLVGNKTAMSILPTIFVDRCVFGPYVDKGLDAANDHMIITNSLFLAARMANLTVAPTTNMNPHVNVYNCTFYQKKHVMTPGKPYPYSLPQYAVSTNGLGNVKIRNSIVYGGLIDVPPSQVINGGNNVQFNVTGNTVALAPNLVDPQFVDDALLSVASDPSQFIPRTLTTADFTPRASQAFRKGAFLTKVSTLCAPYGPNYGLTSVMGGP